MSEQWPKCWGRNTEIFKNDTVSVNLLHLIKGGVCSWHYHNYKNNTFHVVSGKVLIKTEYSKTILEPGQSILIEAPMKHLFEALEDSKLIECMHVTYNPSDIVRLVEGYMKKDV